MYEELVKRLRDISNSDSNIKSNYIGLTMIQAADAIQELQKLTDAQLDIIKQHQAYLTKPRWIPVTERLPEKNVRVLCACRANIFCVMKWDGVDWYENPTHVFMSGFVTHWMPLPEPPKEET